MATNRQIVEGLWALGLRQSVLSEFSTTGRQRDFIARLEKAGISRDQINTAAGLVDFRVDTRNTSPIGLITSVTDRFGPGATQKVVDMVRQMSGGESDNPDVWMRAIEATLGTQAMRQVRIKTGLNPTDWNPFRDDNPNQPKESTADLQARAGVGFMTDLGGPAPKAPAPPGQKPPAGPMGTLGGEPGAGATTTAPANIPAAPPPLSSTASDAEVEAYIRKNFGFAAWALDEPEIRQVLVDFTRDMRGYEFTIDQLEAKLLTTNWWKEKNRSARARIREKNEDPATYNQGILNESEKLQMLVDQAGGGFNITGTRLQEMARTSYKMGWTPTEMRAALAAEFDYNPETGDQSASAIVGRLKQLAGQYLVPLSEATIDEWGRAMISGTANEDTVNGYLREQAKVLLPAFAIQIDAGLTPSALVEPYRQTIARELGSNPTEIDFLDPKWNRFISGRDPKTNQPRAMDPYEIQRTIRTDSTYGWNDTAGARGQATEFVTKLAERFGKAG